MNSFPKVDQSIVCITLEFWDDCVKVFDWKDLNFGAVMDGCCTATMLSLIRHLFLPQHLYSQWKSRWGKRVTKQGDYFEEDKFK